MRISRDPLRISLFLLIILTLSQFHQHFPALAAMRPGLSMTALVALYAFLRPDLLAKGSIIRTWPGKLIAAFFVMACLSVVFGINMGQSGKYILEAYIKTVIFSGLVIAAVRQARDLYTVSWALVLASGILAYMAVFVFRLTDVGNMTRLGDMYNYDANDTGCILTAAIGFYLIHAASSQKIGRILSVAILALTCVAVVRTGSRGAILGMMAVGVALLFLARGSSFLGRAAVIGAGAVGLMLWSPPGYWQQMQTMLQPSQDYNFTDRDGRKQIAQRGIGYMQQYPLFGVGISNFEVAECRLSEGIRVIGPGMKCNAPHNSYVQAGAELGVPGLLLWIALILGGIVGPIALRRRMPAHWHKGDAEERYLYNCAVYLPVTFATYGVTTAFLTFAFMDFTYFLVAFLAGLYVATENKMRQNQLFPPDLPAQGEKAVRTHRGGLPPHRHSPDLPALPTGTVQ